ncbi:MAG: C25 family cysteine peptidase, partial [Acidobacteriota bacterium]
SGLGNGDYVSSAAAPGLDTFYSYFVEVPPGTAQLTAQIFDADIGAGGGGAAFDLDLGAAGLNTGVTYTLLDPTGAVSSGPFFIGPGACGGCNNAWVQFPVVAAPLNGPWEIRVDMSSAVTAGDDLNGLGIRAHDGIAGVGGTELNVYAESYIGLATIGNPSSTTTQTYPYVTGGCEFDANDFDGDAPQAGSALTFNSRTGVFSQTVGISGPTVWQNSTVAGWTTDGAAVDYGAWDAPLTVTAVSGGLGANVVNLWLGDFSAADSPTGGLGPPPSAQPEPGSLRIYLPRDGGGAPDKVYAEQLVTHVSGPNPPQAGLVSRVRVSIRVVNPTPHPVTFGAPARVVTAEVPGAGAVYAGGPLLSQGVLTGQPAIAGTGTVTWDPGVVASGATALLGYLVDVTPPAPGSRVEVTGAPGSLGTAATFLDESARLAQARATYTLGPLCELAVTADLATHASISEVRGFVSSLGAGLAWRTTSEVATVGFDVYRHGDGGDVKKINGRAVPGLLVEPQGGTYRLLDVGAEPGAGGMYSIVELDRSGRSRIHGPFTVSFEDRIEDPGFATAPAVATPRISSATPSVATPGGDVRGLRPPARIGDRLKIKVVERGIHRISFEAVADRFGWSESRVRRAVSASALRLSHRGESVAWGVDTQGLLFFAEPPTGLYATQNIYWLESGEGVRWAFKPEAPAGSPASPEFFPSTLDFETDVFAATVFGPSPESDYWYWKSVFTGHPTFGVASFTFDAPNVHGGGVDLLGPVQIGVRLQSATTEGISDEHQARIRLNGEPLGTLRWSGVAEHVGVLEAPAEALLGTANVLEIEGDRPAGGGSIGFFIDGFSVQYPRRFALGAGGLEVSEAGGTVRVKTSAVGSHVVLDISDSRRPTLVPHTGPAVDGPGSTLSFAADAAVRYWIEAEPSWGTPALELAEPPALTAKTRPAEYVVISPRALLDDARRLVERPQVEDLDRQLVSLEGLYDQFSHGFPVPEAISAYLRAAAGQWGDAPRSVTLVGAGSYDYRDLLGFGTHLMPPRMVLTPDGLFASDQPYADLDGDGSPEVALGRIPARDMGELADYIAKLEAFEAAVGDAGAWLHRWLMVSDREDGAHFSAEGDAAFRRLPTGLERVRVSLDDSAPEVAQGTLFDRWQEGAAVAYYLGHGGLDRLADAGLLTSGSAPGLQNAPRLPVLVAATCSVNRFGLPNFQALGEQLVVDPDGGAIAAFSAVGLSQHQDARELGHGLATALAGPHPTVGEAVLRSSQDYLTKGGSRDLLRLYSLLGDPETPTVPPSEAPGAGPASGDS